MSDAEKNSAQKEHEKNGQKNLPEQSAPRFDVWESHLVNQTGLNKDDLRAIRKNKLTEGVHWATHGQRIVYSQEGVQELQRLAKVVEDQSEKKVAQSNAQQQREPTKGAEIVTLKAFRPAAKNERILEAYLPDKDPSDYRNRVRVRVRSNKNFVLGMDIPCRLMPGYKDFYELAPLQDGTPRREPRSKGVW